MMNSVETLLTPIKKFLQCETPDEWITAALKNQELLLIDHCNCEKKAAGTAMALILSSDDEIRFHSGVPQT